MNIYLCGMIGSGKTAIGLAIARRLRWRFFDLDRVMEEEAGKRIHDVVAEETWLGFREREYAICKRFSRMDRSVIALGGGTVRYEWNRDILRGSGPVVLLTAKLEVLADRVRKNDRPRVNPGVTLEEDLSVLWKRFKYLYYLAADFTYRTDQRRTVLQEAGEIIRIVKRRVQGAKGSRDQGLTNSSHKEFQTQRLDNPMNSMNVYLCGLIGTGKTSIGKEIARQLRRPFYDVDLIMEKEVGKRINDIVAEEGWVSYREKEYNISKRLSRKNNSVVAMAGGTVRYEWNMDVFRKTGVFILLTAPIKTLVNRAEKNDRPRVNLGTFLEKDLLLIWKKYKDRYQQAADFTYRTGGNKTVKQEAREIIEMLKKRKLPD